MARNYLRLLLTPIILLAIAIIFAKMSNKRTVEEENHPEIYGIPSLTPSSHERLWRESMEADNSDFWLKHALLFLDWETAPTVGLKGSFENLSWFGDGRLSVAWNIIDRHDPERVAFVHEPDGDREEQRSVLTYGKLQDESNVLAHYLSSWLKAGETVTLYLPMIPEAAICIAACVRVGLIHNVVFGGFSAEALRSRIQDTKSKLVITVREAWRGGKRLAMRDIVDEAVLGLKEVQVLCIDCEPGDLLDYGQIMRETRDRLLSEYEKEDQEGDKAVKRFKGSRIPLLSHVYNADDPLFMLYTSGSTGKPKGIMHAAAGYLLYTAMTIRWTMDGHHDAKLATPPYSSTIFGCTADIGWITGHSYVFYGPLLNGITSLLLEAPPFYPDPERLWRVAARWKLTHLYTAPTVVRALKRALAGKKPLDLPKISSLKVLGSVGEPIDPESWRWYEQAFGVPTVIDTYWQTETGGHLITPLYGIHDLKPGSALRPFFGIETVLLDEMNGKALWREEVGKVPAESIQGVLAVARPWPGMARTVWGDHERFKQTYLQPYPGFYFTGDRATVDSDGCYWIGGRMDDVINVSAHRLSTAEIEAALCRHPHCAEAAVLGAPDAVTGQAIIAFCIRKVDSKGDVPKDLINELKQTVRKVIGPIAAPKRIILCDDLPKTRSGKIMRRLLRKLVEGESDLGDLSTLNNPQCMEALRAQWQQQDK